VVHNGGRYSQSILCIARYGSETGVVFPYGVRVFFCPSPRVGNFLSFLTLGRDTLLADAGWPGFGLAPGWRCLSASLCCFEYRLRAEGGVLKSRIHWSIALARATTVMWWTRTITWCWLVVEVSLWLKR
jgi:hypothetical protein